MSAIAVFAPPTVISRLRAVDPLRHERLRAEHLSTAATTVLAVGVAISILTTSDKDWWRLHFSKLGTYPDLSGHVFNLTIIVAGVLFSCFAIRTRLELLAIADPAHRRRCDVFTLGVGSLGVHLSAVGLVPLNTNEFLHDRAASGAMLSFIVVLALAVRARRALSARLRVVTLAVIVVLSAAIVVFAAGLINLAGFELIGFTLVGLWTAVFSRGLRLRLLRHESERTATADESVRPAGRFSPLPCAGAPTSHTEWTVAARQTDEIIADDAGCGEDAGPGRHVRPTLHRPPVRPMRSRPPRAPSGAHGARVLPRPGCRGSAAPAASAPSRR